ncbi:hypothetical protein Purlil1_9435 [Purpureocillium lilacinum]|uniref:Uncharacterized protein n=1 Tax=Purpureocillium lilacinum TaxID=33203 RepID=A0ABR0BR04_PURLI|nr:hypothetical protein Purlil1_9435 [Purpureocillium lilacinum]
MPPPRPLASVRPVRDPRVFQNPARHGQCALPGVIVRAGFRFVSFPSRGLFFLLYPCSQSSYLPFEKPKPGRRAAARLARHVVNSFTHSDVIAWAAAAAAQAREAGEGKATTEVGGEVAIYVRGGGTGKAKGKKEGGKREEKKLSCNRDLAREKLLLVATRICSVTAFRRRNVHDTHCSYVRTRTRYASPKVFGRAGPLWNALPFHDEGSLAPLAECPSPSGQFPDSWLAGTQMLRHDTTRHDTMGRRAYNALPCPVRPSWSARLCSAHCSGRTHARPHPVRHPTETGEGAGQRAAPVWHADLNIRVAKARRRGSQLPSMAVAVALVSPSGERVPVLDRAACLTD